MSLKNKKFDPDNEKKKIWRQIHILMKKLEEYDDIPGPDDDVEEWLNRGNSIEINYKKGTMGSTKTKYKNKSIKKKIIDRPCKSYSI